MASHTADVIAHLLVHGCGEPRSWGGHPPVVPATVTAADVVAHLLVHSCGQWCRWGACLPAVPATVTAVGAVSHPPSWLWPAIPPT
ncbi:hypothetical protein [Streptomyces europaeiscabiei]|uniref:hypothetical protein n=1 Tax=Streptomyces europaeiscabiei TaxID=146819 RepID=UPI002E2740D1|nr:hypothetical protein OG858_10370 [Streptomyces europaeiscabiei]